jgi:hypothetical protein
VWGGGKEVGQGCALLPAYVFAIEAITLWFWYGFLLKHRIKFPYNNESIKQV